MGKGDKKTKKGKRFRGSYGVSRPRKRKKTHFAPKKKKSVKAKATVQKETTTKKVPTTTVPNTSFVDLEDKNTLNNHLKKFELSQSIANRKTITDLATELLEKESKKGMTADEIDVLIEKNKGNLKKVGEK